MRILFSLFFLGILINTSGQNLKSGGLLKPEQAITDIRHYTISLDVDPGQQSIDGWNAQISHAVPPCVNVECMCRSHASICRPVATPVRN